MTAAAGVFQHGRREGAWQWRPQRIAIALLLGTSLTFSVLAANQALTPEQRGTAINALAPRYQQWLKDVRGLLTVPELDHFLRLREDFRRDAFMEAFWEPRDPEPRTPANELRQRWDDYLASSSGGAPFEDPRFLLLLFNGPPGGWNLPDGRPAARCFSRSRELEIWFYGSSLRADKRFLVIFQRDSTGSPYEVYRPGDPLRPIRRVGQLPTTNVRLLCADELLRYAASEVNRIGSYDRLLDKVLAPPVPSAEWLSKLAAETTDLPEGAETFEVRLDLGFPARKQSRTAVQVMLDVPKEEAPGQRFGDTFFHNFRLTGEVLRDGQLFESFRYSFEGPYPEGAQSIAVGFTRYLRPGTVGLRVLLEDAYSGKFARLEQQVVIPSTEGLPALPTQLFARDSAAPSLRLNPPPGDVQAGLVRFRARASAPLDKVTFYLDDREILSKRKPPYSAELDLGPVPEPRRVRVVGFVDDQEVATDQLWLNQGAQRFRVRLVEPRPDGIYPGSLTTRAQIETPDGRPPERLEIYLGDTLKATLRDEPYSHSLSLVGSETAVIRAVAYLADGSTSEDTVVVNGAPFTEAVEVRLVELHAVVEDTSGNPIGGLERSQFRVLEEGVPQTIERFEPASAGPLRAALLVDRSVSMEAHLEQVTAAAAGFAEAVLSEEKNQLALLSFADRLTIDSDFGAEKEAVERSLAGLGARGGTALYEALVQALNTVGEGAGASALVLFSDGQDESSRLTYEQALETAKRSGVTLYTLGLNAAFPNKDSRRSLEELATETGGRAYFLESLEELPSSYADILAQLRSRYLIAYSPTEGEDGYRRLGVEVDAEGATVRARRGYYP